MLTTDRLTQSLPRTGFLEKHPREQAGLECLALGIGGGVGWLQPNSALQFLSWVFHDATQ
jgi:hypothetical protein